MTFQELPNGEKKTSDIWVLPLSFEKTVCGKGGTVKAPKEIIKGSYDIEYYEEELSWSPFKYMKIYTDESYKAIPNFKALNAKVKRFLKDWGGQFLLTLGGEHSITPFVTKHLLKRKSTVIFFDAHADFRKEYHGEKNSHASASHNIALQGHDVIAIGLRSFYDDEKKRMGEMGVRYFSDIDLQKKSIQKKLFKCIKKLDGDVYISVDMDCFDPGFVGGVGTPLPGGLDWFMFLKILRKVFKNKNINIIGADIVELIPEKSKVSQVIAAKVMQKIFSYWGNSQGFHKKQMIGSQMEVDWAKF